MSIKRGSIKLEYSPQDKKWVAYVEYDFPVSSGAGSTACTGDTYKEAVNKVVAAGSVEEYFEILQKEADEEYGKSSEMP